MDGFEIRDEEIDVEEIKLKIRENIKKRKESGAYPESDSQLHYLAEKSNPKESDLATIVDDIQKDLDYINSNWDIQNNSYSISSHRPIMGNALIKGRVLVHEEVRRYVDPIIWKQNGFNKIIVKILNETMKITAAAAIVKDTENKALNGESSIKSCITGINTIEKSDEGRKSVDSLNMFTDSLELFKDCKNVLIIGGDSNYFLKIMRENGISGYCIGLNDDFVAECKKIGIQCHKIDTLSHLQSVDNESLDGIFMNQVAENLSLDILLKLFKLIYEKLQHGSYVVIAIFDILSTPAGAKQFRPDHSRQKPLHPEIIKFLLNSCGFKDIQERYCQPNPNEIKLQKVEIRDELNLERLIESYNDNISRLNNILFGFKDCIVLGEK